MCLHRVKKKDSPKISKNNIHGLLLSFRKIKKKRLKTIKRVRVLGIKERLGRKGNKKG